MTNRPTLTKTFAFKADADRVEANRVADASRTPEQRAADMMRRLSRPQRGGMGMMF